jgi:hypothetical protein
LLDPAQPLTTAIVPIWAIMAAVAVATIVAAVAFGRDLHDAIEAVVRLLP